MQIIAMLTMLIDHFGVVFYPDSDAWRLIGRLAFPIYAYAIVQGYKHTRSVSKYMRRLLALAGLSQLPFMLVFDYLMINSIGTLAVSLGVLVVLDRLRSRLASAGVVAAVSAVLLVVPFDYGVYGLFLVLIYRYLPKTRWITAHAALTVAWMLLGQGLGWLQLASVAATMLLASGSLEQLTRVKVPRWLWRSFYPAHLAGLSVAGGVWHLLEGWRTWI